MISILLSCFLIGTAFADKVADNGQVLNPQDAYHRAFQKLLDLPDEPTPLEFLKEISHLKKRFPNFDPFEGRQNQGVPQNLESRLVAEGPQVIALLEWVFPGAQWLPLGRDGAPMARFLEFFYLGVGQTDRVHRLKTSNPTFANATADDILAFLISNGLKIPNKSSDKPLHERMRPFVMLDRTSYVANAVKVSQSTKLMQAGFLSFFRNGYSSYEVTRVFNLVGIGGSERHQVSLDQAPAYFETLKAHFQSAAGRAAPVVGQRNYNGIPDTILHLPFGASRDGVFSDGGVWWHAGYGPFSWNAEKVYEGQTGEPHPLEQRMAILEIMWRVYQTVFSEQFVNAVNRELTARSLKPFTYAPVQMFSRPQTVQGILDHLQKKVEKLSPLDKRKFERLSKNGMRLEKILSDLAALSPEGIERDRNLVKAFEILSLALESDKITVLDFRRQLRISLPSLSRSTEFAPEFRDFVLSNQHMREAFADSAKALFSNGQESIPVYDWMRTHGIIAPSCESALSSVGRGAA